MSAFEIISKDEFEKGSGGVLDTGNEQVGESPADTPGQLHLEWCEFCQEWYLSEYHFGREDE